MNKIILSLLFAVAAFGQATWICQSSDVPGATCSSTASVLKITGETGFRASTDDWAPYLFEAMENGQRVCSINANGLIEVPNYPACVKVTRAKATL